METVFERSDLLQLNPISHRDTLKLLSPGSKTERQKIVVGDDTGTLYCYEFKKGEPVPVFQMQAFESGAAVTCVALGGDSAAKRDKIYAAAGQQVVGISKKGKNFFTMSSSSTEPIHGIHTEDTLIWTSCEYICNVYDNGKDRDLYMSMDRINALCVGRVVREGVYDAILACQDSCIRVVCGSKLHLDIPTTAAARGLAVVPGVGASGHASDRVPMIVVGVDGGDVTLISFRALTSAGTSSSAGGGYSMIDDYSYEWTITDDRHSTAVSICVCELVRGNGLYLVIGREDGRVQVYVQEPPGPDTSVFQKVAPRLIYTHDIGERIQSLVCGNVNSETFQEIIVASFSGKIISFTTEPLRQRDESDTYGRSIATLHNENRIKHLETEIDGLKTKVTKDRSALLKTKEAAKATSSKASSAAAASSSGAGAGAGAASKGSGAGSLSMAEDFAVAITFSLNQQLGAYVLSIEVQRPLDLIVVRSSVGLDVIDQKGDDDKSNNTLVSITPAYLLQSSVTKSSDTGSRRAGKVEECKFIAALRVPPGERRASLAIRPIEGEHGEILVTIVTDEKPKLAKVLKFSIKRLSLHTRVHTLTEAELARPRSKVKFTGNIAMMVVHEWLQDIVAEVPPYLEEGADRMRLFFRNSYTGALATVQLARDEITFESQSASTIAIFKEGLTALANARRVQLTEKLDLNENSMYDFLHLLRPHIERLQTLTKKVQIIDAVAEIVHAETGGTGAHSSEVPPWLTPEYAAIYHETPQIRAEIKNKHKYLEYISGIVTDLHVDWHKLRGADGRSRLPEVAEALQGGQWDRVVEAIMGQKRAGVGVAGSSQEGSGAQVSQKATPQPQPWVPAHDADMQDFGQGPDDD